MNVVAAGVHGRFFNAISGICHGLRTCVGDIGFLFHRQGIDVGAKQDRLPGSIAKDGGDAVPANVGMDFVGIEFL